jgi:preprotein translocase subunit SecE
MKNPLQFIEEVRQETAKVTWPTWKEVWITTIMVLVMVALTATFFLLADMVISRVVRLVLGIGH